MINVYQLSQMDKGELLRLKRRSRADISNVRNKVEAVIAKVRAHGDDALVSYTREFDDPQFTIKRLRVSEEDIRTAYKKTDQHVIEKIKEQISLSKRFHSLQKLHIPNWEAEIEDGILVGEKWTPIDNVGLYVPGGKNPFPTVQQILAAPAKIAGCRRLVSCISPSGDNFAVIIAANECGVDEIYRASGAQAIAALAYGTETIRPVEIIASPGSPYVTAAKLLCQEQVAIDMPAGPSEVLILADETLADGLTLAAKADYCAADLLAQAEHGPDSAVLLVTTSQQLAELTKSAVEKQYKLLSRQDYMATALETYAAIIIVESMQEAIDFSNDYAPEHLEILTADPKSILTSIQHAGSVFLGYYNPVPAGDYATGINHTLPTSGWARQMSPVAVWTFMKRVQYSQLNKKALRRLQPIVQTISQVEGLDAHQYSVDIRFNTDRVGV